MNLRYCILTAFDCGEVRQPCDVINDLGIKFDEWVPQTIADQIWINGCTNVPKSLPKFITIRS